MDRAVVVAGLQLQPGELDLRVFGHGWKLLGRRAAHARYLAEQITRTAQLIVDEQRDAVEVAAQPQPRAQLPKPRTQREECDASEPEEQDVEE